MNFQHPQVSCRYSSSCLARLNAANAAAPEQTKFHLFMPRSHTVDHIKRTIIRVLCTSLRFPSFSFTRVPYTKHLHTKNGMCRQYIHWFRPKIRHLQQGDDSEPISPRRGIVARAPHHACAGGLWNHFHQRPHMCSTCWNHAAQCLHGLICLMILPLSLPFDKSDCVQSFHGTLW